MLAAFLAFGQEKNIAAPASSTYFHSEAARSGSAAAKTMQLSFHGGRSS